jgi:transcriptional regulator with XRE-family HTH domain
MLEFINTDILVLAFRHLLCEERKKRGLTQFELARKSKLTRQSISLFESGHRSPALITFSNLAKGFDIPVSTFMALLMSKVEYYEHKKRILLAAADSKKVKWWTR